MILSSGRNGIVINVACLEAFLLDERWFAFQPKGIHGVPHVTRVLFWSAVLAQRIGNIDAFRWRELLWPAATRDVGRENDDIDPGHGERSAKWVNQHLSRERSMASTLDLGFIAELCRWHGVPGRRVERLSLELLILKDADGLDRCRVRDLKRRRLRFQQTSAYSFQTARDTLSAAAPWSSWLTG